MISIGQSGTTNIKMQPNGYIKVAAMPGGSLPTTRRHLPTQQKGGILYPIIKIPYNNFHVLSLLQFIETNKISLQSVAVHMEN